MKNRPMKSPCFTAVQNRVGMWQKIDWLVFISSFPLLEGFSVLQVKSLIEFQLICMYFPEWVHSLGNILPILGMYPNKYLIVS